MESSELRGVSAHRPPLNALPTLVHGAIRALRLYMYPVPEHLSTVYNDNDYCSRVRAKHPWLKLEYELWNSLPSEIWTTDAESAHFFVVPNSYMRHECHRNKTILTTYVRQGMARYFEYLYYAVPYYNRTRGQDHLITWIFENGPLCDCAFRNAMRNEALAFGMLQSFAKIGYWGHRSTEMFGWRPGHDIAMPQYGAAGHWLGPPPDWKQIVSSERMSFGFWGSFWGDTVTCPSGLGTAAALSGQHSCECSPGIRTWLNGYLKQHCNTSTAPTTRCASPGHRVPMGTFLYALCPAAWACWSSRLYHAIDRLAVPAIMANDAIQPFEQLLDWSSFAVFLDTRPLQAGNLTQLDQLHEDALATARHCRGCPTCGNCTTLPFVQRLRQLELVRTWFLYANESAPQSATGLFVLELQCRHWHRSTGGNGLCRRFPWQQLLNAAMHDLT